MALNKGHEGRVALRQRCCFLLSPLGSWWLICSIKQRSDQRGIQCREEEDVSRMQAICPGDTCAPGDRVLGPLRTCCVKKFDKVSSNGNIKRISEDFNNWWWIWVVIITKKIKQDSRQCLLRKNGDLFRNGITICDPAYESPSHSVGGAECSYNRNYSSNAGGRGTGTRVPPRACRWVCRRPKRNICKQHCIWKSCPASFGAWHTGINIYEAHENK